MTKGRLSLADIGITEEKLEELRINGCKKSAVKYLDKLREGTDIPNFYTDNINKDLTEGGLSLADIGITEKDLEELRNISRAKWLKRIDGLHRSSR